MKSKTATKPAGHRWGCACVDCRVSALINTSVEDTRQTIAHFGKAGDASVQRDLQLATLRRAIGVAESLRRVSLVRVLQARLCQLTPHPEACERAKGKFRWVCLNCGHHKYSKVPARPNVSCSRCGVRHATRDYWSPVGEFQTVIPTQSTKAGTA
jgi:hypothetical protein